MAKANGHTFKKAERLGNDPPDKICSGFRWNVTCEVCGTGVWAALDEQAQIIVGGIPLLLRCEQAKRYIHKHGPPKPGMKMTGE
jgi:hypothetical protein